MSYWAWWRTRRRRLCRRLLISIEIRWSDPRGGRDVTFIALHTSTYMFSLAHCKLYIRSFPSSICNIIDDEISQFFATFLDPEPWSLPWVHAVRNEKCADPYPHINPEIFLRECFTCRDLAFWFLTHHSSLTYTTQVKHAVSVSFSDVSHFRLWISHSNNEGCTALAYICPEIGLVLIQDLIGAFYTNTNSLSSHWLSLIKFPYNFCPKISGIGKVRSKKDCSGYLTRNKYTGKHFSIPVYCSLTTSPHTPPPLPHTVEGDSQTDVHRTCMSHTTAHLLSLPALHSTALSNIVKHRKSNHWVTWLLLSALLQIKAK